MSQNYLKIIGKFFRIFKNVNKKMMIIFNIKLTVFFFLFICCFSWSIFRNKIKNLKVQKEKKRRGTLSVIYTRIHPPVFSIRWTFLSCLLLYIIFFILQFHVPVVAVSTDNEVFPWCRFFHELNSLVESNNDVFFFIFFQIFIFFQ